MNGIKRVLAFCCFLAILPAFILILPLYLRHNLYADVTYPVAESDIMEIRDGISTIFCESHSLRILNGTFNAFQLSGTPKMSSKRKHIRLKKSMSLPDDTLEYWGFYLMKGATVQLKVCSRYDGSRILVVKGERNLNTCGLLNHTKNKISPQFNKAHKHVKVTFEDVAEFINKHDFEDNTLINNVDDESVNTINNGIMTSTVDEEIDIKNDASEIDSNELIDYIKKKDNSNKYDEDILELSTTKQITINQTKKTDNINEKAIKKITNYNNNNSSGSISISNVETVTELNTIKNRQRRHHLHRNRYQREYQLQQQKHQNQLNHLENKIVKRDIVYDRKISHGGNAKNYSKIDESESASSFENGLLQCYDGQILLAQSFRPSAQCTNVNFLDESTRMITTHEVVSDGYYYYIFYSDNDYVQNDINAVFNIYKPTFQYPRMSETKICMRGKNCTFPIKLWSDETVIIEMPTRDGLAHNDDDDQTVIISRCNPRMGVYIIFPIALLIIILTCAFL